MTCSNCGKKRVKTDPCFECSKCSIPDCGRKLFCRGYCQTHYARFRRGEDLNVHVARYWGEGSTNCSDCGTVLPPLPRSTGTRCPDCYKVHVMERRKNMRCEVENCDGLYVARGFCTTHYSRLKKHGSAYWEPRTPFADPNAQMRDWRKRIRSDDVPEYLHGTTTAYTSYACRCDLCTKAQREYARVWRDRRKAQEES